MRPASHRLPQAQKQSRCQDQRGISFLYKLPSFTQTSASPAGGPIALQHWFQESAAAMPVCGHTQLPTGSPMSLSLQHSTLALSGICVHSTPPPRHGCSTRCGCMRLAPKRARTHLHTHMHALQPSPGDPPSLGWLTNGHNLILIESLHCKPVQGLIGAAERDRWSGEPTPLSPRPCSLDLYSPPAILR